jgi:hypothetical protein
VRGMVAGSARKSVRPAPRGGIGSVHPCVGRENPETDPEGERHATNRDLDRRRPCRRHAGRPRARPARAAGNQAIAHHPRKQPIGRAAAPDHDRLQGRDAGAACGRPEGSLARAPGEHHLQRRGRRYRDPALRGGRRRPGLNAPEPGLFVGGQPRHPGRRSHGPLADPPGGRWRLRGGARC